METFKQNRIMSKLWIENNGTAAYYQEIAPAVSYTDKSNDIEAWNLFGESTVGYKLTRDKIKALVIIATNPNYPTLDFSGWAAYSYKSIAAKWVVAPYALRVTVHTDNIDSDIWDVLVEKTKSGRAGVVELMRKRVSDELRKETLTKYDTDDFWDATHIIFNEYIDANGAKFKDWLSNTEGSDYENNGFAQKEYFTEELRDDLLNIYKG
jgi:hypothetical protein